MIRGILLASAFLLAAGDVFERTKLSGEPKAEVIMSGHARVIDGDTLAIESVHSGFRESTHPS